MAETRAPVLRAVLFAIIAVHMQLGSVFDQVLHLPRPLLSMSWEMYSGKAVSVCAVQWYTAGPEGMTPIDRIATLGLDPFWSAPTNERLQHSEDEVRSAAQRLCRKLGKAADVRADARCGLPRTGIWKQRLTTDEGLCGRSPSRRAPK